MTNAQLIGIDPTIVEKLTAGSEFLVNKTIPNRQMWLDKEKNTFGFSSLVNTYCQMPASSHLGVGPVSDGHKYGRKALEVVLQYFSSEWTKSAKEVADRQCLNKVTGNDDLRWSDNFLRGFLMALLLKDKKAIEFLANWPECWMNLDPGMEEPLIGKIYVSVAAAFRTTPLKGLEEMEAQVLKSRSKTPKLLLQTWIAARNSDAAGFAKNLTDSLRQFEKTMRQAFNAADYLALRESLILAAARERGMDVPEIEPRLMARLMTRESLQLG